MSAQVGSRVAEDESRRTSTSPLFIHSTLGMPTPETTPAPQDTLLAFKPVTSDSLIPMRPQTKEQSSAPESVKQPWVNVKNEPHPGQSTIPAEQTLSMPLSMHITALIPTPTATDVDIHNVSAQPDQPSVSESEAVGLVIPPTPTTGVADNSTSAFTDRTPSPDVQDSPLTPLPGLEAFMDVNDAPSELSPPLPTQPSDALPSYTESPTNDKAQRIAVETTTASRSTQRGDMGAAPKVTTSKTDAIVGSQIKAKAATKDKSSEAVSHVKGSKKSENIEGRSVNKEKRMIKQGRPPKPIVTFSSKPQDVSHRLVTASVTPERGKHKADPVKRKAEDRSEGPAKKRGKVSKYESVPVTDALQMDEAHTDSKTKSTTTGRNIVKTKPSYSKSNAKKKKLAPSSHFLDEYGLALFDLTSIQFEELQGLLIEAFAVSRASSQSASALYRGMSQSRPSLKNDHSDKEWLQILESVLEAARSQSGIFGKVESSFKVCSWVLIVLMRMSLSWLNVQDDSAHILEAKWFYVPERDPDQERAAIIRNMMPRAGKRSETKKYKQYYYQPLDKISRWDPEDDL